MWVANHMGPVAYTAGALEPAICALFYSVTLVQSAKVGVSGDAGSNLNFVGGGNVLKVGVAPKPASNNQPTVTAAVGRARRGSIL